MGHVPQSLLPDSYLPLLDELNRIVLDSGEKLEGNLFYYHHEPNPSRHSVYGEFYPKRRNYLAACRASTCMLEIGVNGGHSALLALAGGVEYHGVDICEHRYTRPVAEFLKSQFGERFHFYQGDSVVEVPRIAKQFPYLRFDLIHVDGLHSLDHCRLDTENSLAMALQGAWLMIDDTDIDAINAYFESLLDGGVLREDMPAGWEHYFRHRIGRVAT